VNHIVSWTVKYNMSVFTQIYLIVPGEARPLKIAPDAIYTSSLFIVSLNIDFYIGIYHNFNKIEI